MHYVYILQCADGAYYVGHTSDLAERLNTHNAGQGAAYTKARRPVHLVYSEPLESKAAAMKREQQLKRWSRAKKEALIRGKKEALKAQARCRGVYGEPV